MHCCNIFRHKNCIVYKFISFININLNNFIILFRRVGGFWTYNRVNFMMKRSLYVFIGVTLSLLISCAVSPLPPPESIELSDIINLEDVYNDIDAVASASKDIRINSGIAHYTMAVIETYHKDSYPFHFIAYGIDSLYNDTLIVADTPRVHICTLFNLVPETVYNFSYVGNWPSNPIVENHGVFGSFTTVEHPLYFPDSLQ